MRLGEEAVTRAGLPPLHPEIVKLLGRLHFRHSFSQNILDHSVEVAHLMGLMAAELDWISPTAKRAGLLHDIGKAVNHEVEGPHAVVGADFSSGTGNRMRSSTASLPITTTSRRSAPMESWSVPPTPSAPPVPAPGPRT